MERDPRITNQSVNAAEEWRPDPDEVSQLAYFYYEERGYVHGLHEDDWHRAERELRRRREDQAESGMPPREDVRGSAAPERTVVGVFESTGDAQRAFDDLLREGFSHDEISLIANQSRSDEWTARTPAQTASADLRDTPETDTASDVAADAGIGAAVGGVGGLLLSFAGLAIPGIGPVLAAGPIVAALGGAGVGAATGGLIGALTDRGVPEEAASHYAEGVRRGDVLVAVHASSERADRASEILNRNGAVNIDDRVSQWRTRGWTRHDPSASPLSKDEIRREREYYRAAERQGDEWAERSQTTVAGSGLTGSEAANARDDKKRTDKSARKGVRA